MTDLLHLARQLPSAAPPKILRASEERGNVMPNDRAVLRRVQDDLRGKARAAPGAVTDQEADSGGQALREHQMAGRFTRPWSELPQSDRKKWIETARVVIAAANAAGRGTP